MGRILCVGLSVTATATALCVGGCVSEVGRKHENLRVWIYQINDGHGDRHPLFSRLTHYELMARALLDKHQSVRIAAVRGFTTGVVAAGEKYVYLPDAYIGGNRDEMLAEHLGRARQQAEPGSWERLLVLKATVQLRMRQYLWAHPEFGRQHDIPRDPPQRGFRPFWLDHYLVFADQILAEGDEQFARDWQEYREARMERFGEDADPAIPPEIRRKRRKAKQSTSVPTGCQGASESSLRNRNRARPKAERALMGDRGTSQTARSEP